MGLLARKNGHTPPKKIKSFVIFLPIPTPPLPFFASHYLAYHYRGSFESNRRAFSRSVGNEIQKKSVLHVFCPVRNLPKITFIHFSWQQVASWMHQMTRLTRLDLLVAIRCHASLVFLQKTSLSGQHCGFLRLATPQHHDVSFFFSQINAGWRRPCDLPIAMCVRYIE